MFLDVRCPGNLEVPTMFVLVLESPVTFVGVDTVTLRIGLFICLVCNGAY